MKKYIAPEVKAYNVSTQAMLAGSGEASVYSTQAAENSEGLSKSASSWIDDEE